MGICEKTRSKGSFIFADLNVTYSAYFGNLGPDRPREEIFDPNKARDLTNYLKKKNLTLQNFEAMIAGTYQPATEDHQNQYQQQQKPANPKPLLQLSLKNPFEDQKKNFGNIEKIQTNRGLVLSTGKFVESRQSQFQERPKPRADVDHKPSKKVEADFVQTKRLQDFRSNYDQTPKTKVSEVRSGSRPFLLDSPNAPKKQTLTQHDDELQVKT